MEFAILVDLYNAVTPFGREGYEGPPSLPPEPLFYWIGIIRRT